MSDRCPEFDPESPSRKTELSPGRIVRVTAASGSTAPPPSAGSPDGSSGRAPPGVAPSDAPASVLLHLTCGADPATGGSLAGPAGPAPSATEKTVIVSLDTTSGTDATVGLAQGFGQALVALRDPDPAPGALHVRVDGVADLRRDLDPTARHHLFRALKSQVSRFDAVCTIHETTRTHGATVLQDQHALSPLARVVDATVSVPGR